MKRLHPIRVGVIALLLALGMPVLAGAAVSHLPRHHHGGHGELRATRAATAPFHSLRRAKAAGYTTVVQDLSGNTCIAEPGEGAMGVHYLNESLLDNAIDARTPELLVYEPRRHGRLKLVALEYLVLQSAWDAGHSQPPSLFGQTFNFTPEGNRFGLPAYYSLHAWIWKRNPSGLFEMWNPRVSCP